VKFFFFFLNFLIFFFFFVYKFNKFFSLYFKNYLCPFKSLKLIIKGRFGKTRKQIFKLNYGRLYITTFIKNIRYVKFNLTTKKGSYGFHFWVLFKNSYNI